MGGLFIFSVKNGTGTLSVERDFYNTKPEGISLYQTPLDDVEVRGAELVVGTWEEQVVKEKPNVTIFSSGQSRVTAQLKDGRTLTSDIKIYNSYDRFLGKIFLFLGIPILILIALWIYFAKNKK